LNGSGLVPDCSGNGLDGTPTNITFVTSDGRQAASFNGSSSKIDCNSNIIGTGAFTFAGWIYLNGWGGGGYGRIADNGRRILHVFSSYGGPVNSFRYDNGAGTGASAIAADNALSLDAWCHVAVTCTAAGIVNFYVNGTLSGAADQAAGVMVGAPGNVLIGNNAGATRAFNGLMGDLRLYDGVTSVEKIQAIHRDREGRPYPWQKTVREATVEEVVCYG
jgi:hypothetical protein